MTDNTSTPSAANDIATTGEAGNLSAEGAAATTPTPEGKTFNQEQVNAIVSERLQKERQKLEGGLAAREAELNQREYRIKATEIMATHKLPLELLEVLNANDEESLVKALQTLDKHFHYSNPNKLLDLPPSGGSLPADGGVRQAFGLPL